MIARQALAVRRRLLRRFARNDEGAIAVEFALVALPFFAILFAILETALIFFAGQLMETGLADAARLIRTGQAQEQKFDKAKFKEAVCSGVFALLDCDNGLRIDVRKLQNFSTRQPAPIDDEGKFTDDDFVYDPGLGGDIMLVRAFYEWPTVLPDFISPRNLANGNFLLSAAATFRNEPF
ncbi:TadE/TadG family type IV pilus assembly protein [Microbaculum sp. FT89]|uniref:TadE/TadG family type IV pilus assembly protein n=1 Tax=Microbaculum sp. FT89 TaxID=3447298 RepID=UPI003F538BA1